ncbi:MAG: DUF5658 family protein [Chloroflexi bacterium]|nr:DUF5658 family protein [Chloroflexota bacterium]
MMETQVDRNSAFTPSLLLLTWAALNVMDALLTFHHLTWGGFEGNPLLASLQTELGSVPMLAAKVTSALVIGLLLTRTHKHGQLSLAGAGMAIVVLYNAALVPFVLAA